MILDGLTTFTGTSQGASGGVASGAQTDAPTTGTQTSSNIIDLGVKSGIPASTGTGGAPSGGGARDIGTGDDPSLKLSIIVTTAFTIGTSLQVNLQGAPDNGSGSPGSYTTMWTGPVVAEANLLAGIQYCNIDMPRPQPDQPLPRFLQLQYITVGTHTTGQIEGQIVIDRDDQVLGVTGLYSGYPAGQTVSN